MDKNYAVRVPIFRASFNKAIEGSLVVDIMHGRTVTEPFRREGERDGCGGSCLELANVPLLDTLSGVAYKPLPEAGPKPKELPSLEPPHNKNDITEAYKLSLVHHHRRLSEDTAGPMFDRSACT